MYYCINLTYKTNDTSYYIPTLILGIFYTYIDILRHITLNAYNIKSYALSMRGETIKS